MEGFVLDTVHGGHEEKAHLPCAVQRLAEDGEVVNKAKWEAQLSHKPRSAGSNIGWLSLLKPPSLC